MYVLTRCSECALCWELKNEQNIESASFREPVVLYGGLRGKRAVTAEPNVWGGSEVLAWESRLLRSFQDGGSAVAGGGHLGKVLTCRRSPPSIVILLIGLISGVGSAQ